MVQNRLDFLTYFLFLLNKSCYLPPWYVDIILINKVCFLTPDKYARLKSWGGGGGGRDWRRGAAGRRRQQFHLDQQPQQFSVSPQKRLRPKVLKYRNWSTFLSVSILCYYKTKHHPFAIHVFNLLNYELLVYEFSFNSVFEAGARAIIQEISGAWAVPNHTAPKPWFY